RVKNSLFIFIKHFLNVIDILTDCDVRYTKELDYSDEIVR
ncbi:15110_t:CDS:1, partial [Racocetra fulgida]